MTTLSFYARGVNLSASNSYINVRPLSQVPVTELTFSQTAGPLSFTYNNGLPDPDTMLTIGSVTMSFTVNFSGNLPNSQKFAKVNGQDLRGAQIVVITAANGTRYVFLSDPDASFLTMLDFPDGAAPLSNYTTSGPPLLICFAKGTWIETPFGERKVETLQPGDLVRNVTGQAVRLRWVAHRTLSTDDLAQWPELCPIRIPANHFGRGLPHRPLRISPQHRLALSGWQVELMFGVDDILVPAKHLLGRGITQETAEKGVDYYHLLFDQHEIVLSNGLPSESYQPSADTVDAMEDSIRAEFAALFGQEAQIALMTRPDACVSLRAHEGRALARALAA